jgi:hypothetical protein
VQSEPGQRHAAHVSCYHRDITLESRERVFVGLKFGVDELPQTRPAARAAGLMSLSIWAARDDLAESCASISSSGGVSGPWVRRGGWVRGRG